MSDTDPIIFISSTCDDLADLRAELRADLEKDRFIVRLSEDRDSDFRTDAEANTIQRCLKNIETSDTVLFIFDRRYGGAIPGDEKERSATHIEYDHARKKGIPSLFFVRGRTWDQLDIWNSNREGYPPKYVKSDECDKLFKLIAEIQRLNPEDPKNNWVETFKNSVELRGIVRHMLYKLHPAYAGARAKRPERIVRLTFGSVNVGRESHGRTQLLISLLRNAGMNVSERVEVFVMGDGQRLHLPASVGGTRAEKDICFFEVLAPHEGREKIALSIPMTYASGAPQYPYGDLRLVCEYRNLWRDRYRVWAPLEQTNSNPPYSKGREEFEVIEAT